MEQFIGHVLDQRYRIDRFLGKGGRGTTFQGHDLDSRRDIAIKILDRSYITPLELQQGFSAWRDRIVHLDRPNFVIPFYINVSKTGLPIYYVSEFIPGGDLGQNRGKLSLVERIKIVRQICLALDSAHQQGIFHKALKPENILLDGVPNGTTTHCSFLSDMGLPALTDVGLTKLLAIEPRFAATSLSRTLMYLSPEQARDEPVDARTDIYALGILLYELATGEVPFHVKTIAQAVRHHTEVAPPPLCDRQPGLPEQLERIILKMLAKNPVDRFQSMASLAQALDEVIPDLQAIEPASPARSVHRTKDQSLLLNGSTLRQNNSSSSPPLQPPIETPARSPLQPHSASTGHSPEASKPLPAPPPISDRSASNGSDSIKVDYNVGGYLTVNPGETLPFTFAITNQAKSLQEFNLSIEGIPSQWVTHLPSRIQLDSNESKEIRIIIKPPQAPTTRAGQHNLIIKIYNPNLPGIRATIQKPINIGRYTKFSCQLSPKKQRLDAGSLGRLLIHNQSNSTCAFLVRWHEATGKIKFKPDRERLQIPAGEHRTIFFKALPSRNLAIGYRPLIQNLERHSCSIAVSLDNEHQTLEAEIITRGIVPARFGLYFVMSILVSTLACALWLLVANPPTIENVVLNPMQPTCNQPFALSWLIDEDAWGVEVGVLANSTQIATDLGPREQYLFPEGVSQPYALTVEASNLFGADTKSVNVCGLEATLITSPSQVREGESVIVQWNTVNAQTVLLEPFGLLNKDEFSGSKIDRPRRNTIYRLTATNGIDPPKIIEQAINVIPGSAPEVEFRVDPSVVTLRQDEVITLSWQIVNADTATIHPNVGTIVPCDETASELCTQQVLPAPTADTVYTLVAENPVHTITSTAKVTVVEADTPEIINFSASPSVVTTGVNPSVVLSWETTGASLIKIDPDIGEVPPAGEKQILAPIVDTTYTLTAQNGQMAPDVEAVTIKVQAASPPIINSFIVVGESQILIDEDNREEEIEIKLSWDVANVTDNDQVIITRNFDGKTIANRVSGSTIDRIPAISREVIYTLFVQKSDGQTATGSVRVNLQLREQ